MIGEVPAPPKIAEIHRSFQRPAGAHEHSPTALTGPPSALLFQRPSGLSHVWRAILSLAHPLDELAGGVHWTPFRPNGFLSPTSTSDGRKRWMDLHMFMSILTIFWHLTLFYAHLPRMLVS